MSTELMKRSSGDIMKQTADPLRRARLSLDLALCVVAAQRTMRHFIDALTEQLKPIIEAVKHVMSILPDITGESNRRTGVEAQHSPYGPTPRRERRKP